MDTVFAVVGLLFFIFACWNLVLVIFSSKRRKKAFKFLWVSLLGFVIFVIFVAYLTDSDAKKAGFIDSTDQRLAEEAGFKNSEEWQVEREQFLSELEEKKRVQAEIEKIEREDAAQKLVELEEKQNAEAAAEAQAEELALKAEEDKCRNDLSCWGEKGTLVAMVYCPEEIEKLAIYDFEWVDGLLGAKFSHYRWADKEAGIVTVLGDRIKFQTGFGAWQYHVYACDVDPANAIALKVSAEPGRL